MVPSARQVRSEGRSEPDATAAGSLACTDSARRALLVPYALSACREDEALDFEVHLLACELCFQDLKVLDRAGVLIREHADRASSRPRS